MKRLRETSGPTVLTIGAVADEQLLKRAGATLVGAYRFPPGHLYGFKLSWQLPTMFAVSPGSAASGSDTPGDIQNFGGSVDMTAEGDLGMDVITATGTGALAAGTVTGTGTAFLTEFAPREQGSSASTTGTAVTGDGFLLGGMNPPKVNDLWGNASKGFSRIASIESNTAMTLAVALPGGNMSSEQPSLIEQPTISVGSVKTTVNKITSDTSLVVSDAVSSVGAGATIKIGVHATTGSDPALGRHYSVWVTSNSVRASTQRTRMLALPGACARRVGFVTTARSTQSGHTTAYTKGDIIGFQQIGNGTTRRMSFLIEALNSNTDLVEGSGGTGGTLTDLHVFNVPPSAVEVDLLLEADNPAGGGFQFSIQSRNQELGTKHTGPDADWWMMTPEPGEYEAQQFRIPCDSAQYIQWNAPNDANNPYNIACLGYVDEL